MPSYIERLVIQSDWQDIYKNKIDEFWVQFKSSTGPAVNGKLKYVSNEFTGSEHFSGKKLNNKSIEVSYKDHSRKFVAPSSLYSVHKKSVISIDVTNGGLGVSSAVDGSLYVWECDTGVVRRDLSGHVGDVNICKFFPSGLVVISGAADLRMKIWSAEDGSCPVTLVGHAGGVTDVAIIDKGKNIVSVSRDGSCKLWNVGASKCLATLYKGDSIINSCDIFESPSYVSSQGNSLAEGEVGTENKLVACACEDGFLRVISVASRNKTFEINCENPVNSCTFLNENTIVSGTEDGYISLWDLRNTSQPQDSWKEFRSAILCVKRFQSPDSFMASTADGSCFLWNLNAPYPITELTGPDCDPVYKFSYNNNYIFTCSRDKQIRRYDLSNIV